MSNVLGDLQDDLFEAFARRTDPQTSHDAAASVEGALPHLERVALEAAVAFERATPPGLTNDRLVAHTGLPWKTITPRIRPLLNKGKLRVLLDDEGKPVKRPGISGRGQQVVVLNK